MIAHRLNKVFPGFPVTIQIILVCMFLLVGCEGVASYIIGVAGNVTADYVTDKYVESQDSEGQIFQLNNGKWISRSGRILSPDDPRIPRHDEFTIEENK